MEYYSKFAIILVCFQSLMGCKLSNSDSKTRETNSEESMTVSEPKFQMVHSRFEKASEGQCGSSSSTDPSEFGIELIAWASTKEYPTFQEKNTKFRYLLCKGRTEKIAEISGIAGDSESPSNSKKTDSFGDGTIDVEIPINTANDSGKENPTDNGGQIGVYIPDSDEKEKEKDKANSNSNEVEIPLLTDPSAPSSDIPSTEVPINTD